MTESEWLSSSDPLEMLYQNGERVSLRKLWLCACACYRTTQLFLDDQHHRDAVLMAERLADDPPSVANTAPANNEELPDDALLLEVAQPDERSQSYAMARQAVLTAIENSVANVSFMSGRWHSTREEKASMLASLLRDVVGVPNLSWAVDPAWLRWRDAAISRLAQQMYDSRDFASMPILADALEEAGCASGDILEHCRGPGPHVRGCWVVDLILGKE